MVIRVGGVCIQKRQTAYTVAGVAENRAPS